MPEHATAADRECQAHPGSRARDARGETWFVELDPRSNPEGATGAVEIATKMFWALGYNEVETFLATFDPSRATIDPKATVRRPSGTRAKLTWDDVHAILERAARNADGTHRIVAGRLIPGRVLGNFLFAGTRADDPNDIVPHQHRRELRALRVFRPRTTPSGCASTTPHTRRSRSPTRRARRHRSKRRGVCRRRSGATSRWTSPSTSQGYTTWRRPIRTWFRRQENGWTLVGLERLPETLQNGGTK